MYGPPKVGKTCAVAALPDSLILELEPEGANWFPARKVDVPDFAYFVKCLERLTALREAKTPACKRLVVDTVDVLEWWCDPAALADYKRTVMGKDFQGTSITELPMGAGYGRLRDKLGEMLWLLSKASEEVLLLAHVRDKFIGKTSGDVMAQDIDLTGKCRNIVASRCSTIGFLRRDIQDNLWVTFKTSETVNCSSRCEHLRGREVKLGWLVDGKPVFGWNKIYLEDNPPLTAQPACA
jgi:hypothetical protein